MNTPDPSPSSVRTLPWVTGLSTLAAVAIYFHPRIAANLVYDRSLITQGQWWRLFTCHWVHFSPSHLGWNLAVLLPAGIWAERLQPGRARWLYFAGAVIIGSALYSLEPHLARYGGLSGMAAAMLAFLALAQLRTATPDRWFWRSVLALLALKIVVEIVIASPLLAHVADPTIRSVPLSHLSGVIAALLSLNVRRRRGMPDQGS